MTQAFQNSADNWLTGTGRLVQGDPWRANDEKYGGAPGQKLDNGRVEYFVAVAFDKTQDAATNFPAMWATMQAVAQQHKFWSQYAAAGGAGFKYKLVDGDAPGENHKPGFAGHWVLKFKNGFAPDVFDVDGSKIQPGGLKCGHYVRVGCSIKCNAANPPQSGLYLNFNMIQRLGFGPEITTGPDYQSIIMQNQAAVVPGMQSMPIGGATTPGMPGAAPGMPATPGVPATPGAPATPGLPGAAPGLPGGVPAGMPPAAPATPAAPAAPAPVVETPQQRMLVNDYTYDGYIAANWTEEMLIQHGKMRPAAAAAPAAPAAPAGAPGMPPAAGALPPAGHSYNQ